MQNIWFITQESRGIVKVGGLGEVIYNLAFQLGAKKRNTVIFMPSHGVINDREITKKLSLSLLSEDKSKDLMIYHGKLKNIDIVLMDDKNGFLSNPIVYGDGITEEKVAKISSNISWILKELFYNGFNKPDIIHVNDWHGVPIGLSIKGEIEKMGEKIGSLLQIHLLIGKYVSEKYFFDKCGFDPNYEYHISDNKHRRKARLSEIYSLSGGVLERIGAYVFDKVATVSESYLKKDEGCVLCSLGWNFESKSTFIYNGTDWKISEIRKNVIDKFWSKISSFTGKDDIDKITRDDLRRFLLLYALDNLPSNEPIIKDEYLRNIVYGLKGDIISEKGKPRGFFSDGSLVITTGRVSSQKGFDILLEAIPQITSVFPEAKFLFLLLPVRGEESLIKQIFDIANRYPENVRVVYGIAGSIYHLAHISADVFVASSRWEPFGIMVIEALATGNPVVASRVGGLSEIIIDLREDKDKGVGLLVNKNDPNDLAEAVKFLLTLKVYSHGKKKHLGYLKESYRHYIANFLNIDDVYQKIREKCIQRVDEKFRWNKVSETALKIYSEILRAI